MNMNNIFKLLTVLAIVISAVACTKVTSNEGLNNVFTEKLDSIQIGEPVVLSFNNGNSAAVVSWTVSPADSITIEKTGAYATLYFAAPGTYTVVASASGKQASYQVKVINKTYNESGTSFAITASKLVSVLPNEVVQFNIQNATSSIRWTTVGTQGLMNVFNNTLSAAISFRGGSVGTVIASDSFHSQSRTIWLSDTSSNTAFVTVPFIFSDKINITPSVSTDSSGNKTLIMTAKTTYNYQSNADQILNLSTNANGACSLSYGGVIMAAVPQVNVSPAACVNSFSGLTPGTYSFTVQYANQTLTGSISLNAAGVFTINWLPNNYISIYPLTVQ